MVEYLDGGRIQGISALVSTPPQTSWKELDRVTLSSAGDTINTGSFTAKDNLMVLMFLHGNTAPYAELTFNDSSGNQYAERYSDDGGSDGTRTNKALIQLGTGGALNRDTYIILNIANLASQEKLVMMKTVEQDSTGANAPERQEVVAKWVNTSDQITSIKVHDTRSGHDFNTGSQIVVLGYNNDEADSGTNFWQEIGSFDFSSGTTGINNESFAAKKYLMFKWYFTSGSGGSGQYIRYNNDTGGNYARRHSIDGASDGTATSDSEIYISPSTGAREHQGVLYVVNVANKEKLGINETMTAQSGAGNAPQRRETVSKWRNTSSQITSITFSSGNSASYTSGVLKVYGAD